MARLIDNQAAVDRYYAEFEKQDICDGAQDRDWLKRCFDESPTIDPVHAAGACYCRECNHLLRDLSSREYHMCMRLILPKKVDLDDFCSYGWRREDTK